MERSVLPVDASRLAGSPSPCVPPSPAPAWGPREGLAGPQPVQRGALLHQVRGKRAQARCRRLPLSLVVVGTSLGQVARSSKDRRRHRFCRGRLAGGHIVASAAAGRASGVSTAAGSQAVLDSAALRESASKRQLQGKGGYSPQAIEEEALQEPWGVFSRALQVTLTLSRFYATLRLDEWLGKTGPDTVKLRSQDLREMLTQLGPCYIKIGQALANRPDIMRVDFMEELEALQDKVPPFPTETAMKILRQELGASESQVFSELSKEPVAAASLGQVYRGRLRKGGQEVAVKIQRPGLRSQLCIDMYLFRWASQFVNSLAQERLGCNATLIVDEFGAKLWEESNYLIESSNAQAFHANFTDDPIVKIPEVYPQHTSERVITMEWISGVKSTDRDSMRRAGIDIETFTRNGVQTALRQLLEFGLFHGDPHAGNIFALKGGRIAYVDFGNVAYITSQQRDVMVRAITHVANSDYDGLAEDFIYLGFLRPGSDISGLVPAMERIWADSMGKTIRDFNFRTVTSRFSKLVYQFPIRVPERFSLVIRSLLMQEGICICLNPDFSIIEVALPYASKRLLLDPDPAMRKELMSVVFREERGRSVFQWARLRNLISMAKQAQGGAMNIDGIVVDFFRSVRRDLVRSEGNMGLQATEVLRSGLEALLAGDRLRLKEAREVAELLGEDLTPELVQKVVDALVRDTVQDVIDGKGIQLSVKDLADPRRVGKLLLRSPKLEKLLPLPVPAM